MKKLLITVILVVVLFALAQAESQIHITFNLPEKYTDYSFESLIVSNMDFLFENNSMYFSSIFTNEIAVQDIFGISKKIGNKFFPALLFSDNGKIGYFSAVKNAVIIEDKTIVIPKIKIPSKIAFFRKELYLYYYDEHSLYVLKKGEFKLVEKKCAGFAVLKDRIYTAVLSPPYLVIKDLKTRSQLPLWISNYTHFSLLCASHNGTLYVSAINEKDFNTYLFNITPGGFITSCKKLPEHLAIKVDPEGIIYYINIISNKARIEFLE
ncbi:hypothetical protein KAJ27_01410 [bacterium]|nr:hypothetical protein [bacterium]